MAISPTLLYCDTNAKADGNHNYSWVIIARTGNIHVNYALCLVVVWKTGLTIMLWELSEHFDWA